MTRITAPLLKHPLRIAMTMLTSALLAPAGLTAAETVAPAAEAAGIGAWTTDWPAAQKVAQERHLPLFIQFTGSDWCGWCQKMEKECLSKPEFLDAMKTRCVLVVADFPRHTTLPDALKTQNEQLAAQFKKSGGFPHYYMVDADAKTTHWSWGAHPKYGKDMKLLIRDIENFVAGCDCVVERVAKGLPADKADAYRKAAKPYAEKRKSVTVWLGDKHPDAKAAKEKFTADCEELIKLKAAMDEILGNTRPD